LNISGYNIDLENVVKTINKQKYERVVLQLPEGLKGNSVDFIDFIENQTDAEVLVSADPCFGACDLICNRLENIGANFIVQIGHAPIPELKEFSIPTVFVNAKYEVNIDNLTKKVIPHLKGKKVGLISTAQHVDDLTKIGENLTDSQFESFVGEGDTRIAYRGQILGCNFSSAKKIADDVDMYLFVGSGTFHPLGLMLGTKKPVVAYDPYTNEVKTKELDDLKDMILKQRYGAIARSKDAKSFGILVGLKPGQQRFGLVEEIKGLIESKDKKVYEIVVDHFSPQFLEGFRHIDCFVSTGCPRIAIDDYLQYKIPIITPIELKILLGLIPWDDYKFDEIVSI
jgi:2-(3-amino-3-carboxypropyl)histidine synthase